MQQGAQYAEVVRFYHKILGLKIVQVWGDENAPGGTMFDTGSGLIEIFTNKTEEANLGIIRHLALETTDADECAVIIDDTLYSKKPSMFFHIDSYWIYVFAVFEL